MTAALVTVVLAAQAAWLAHGSPPVADGWLLVVVALLFALAEKFVVAFSVRRGAHGVSLSEIPLVLGLVMIHPVLLVAVRLVGGVAGLTAVRGQRGSKLAFNLS